ncbi:MAG: TRAP transporter fused permease subunit [Rhodospirillales bacterium]|nr:TRAP transporter fused permease subunit [Rhodospirillales bacterium]
MDEQVSRDQSQRFIRYAAFAVALVIAITGVLNSMPTYGFFTPIGPFPAIILRPIFVGAAVFLVLANNSFTSTFAQRRPNFKWLGRVIDVVILLFTWWVLWEYYDLQVSEEVDGFGDVGMYDFSISLLAASLFIILSWKTWGRPLSIVGILALIYFYTGEYWPWIFETARVDLPETSEDLWFNQGDGILGTIMGIIIFTVFPFIMLGTMLERTGGGRSLIKLAVHVTKRFRGGPAHSAILASSLFGTMSGGAVTNVVATGVITIPMIKQRGFSPSFAGGVEATASSAGQIMPPIMGAAAFVMADLTGISYLTIIIAALVPALAYYTSLFTSVVFEARRLGVEVGSEDLDRPELQVNSQDFVNLSMIIIPVAVVITSLLQGLSAAGAGMTAFFAIIPLSFFNPEVRQRPFIIIEALSYAGLTFGRLLMAIAVVGIVVAVLGATGLPKDFVVLIDAVSGGSLFLTLLVTGVAALMLGMGMPTLPAYLTIVLILGPAMQNLGLTVLAAHLFVLYYAVASSITPPVAIAAYAAASIAEAPPIRTAMMALRVGLVKFAIPFVFAYYPVILIVPVVFPEGSSFQMVDFLTVLFRLLIFIYLISSAVIAFDQRRLPILETGLRIALAILVMVTVPGIHWTATAIALAYIAWHQFAYGRQAAPTAN